ncbi:MAG: hypothetical protein KVP17_004832 [Porospora cf. gigantea B]|uniref:uncharacterized protein n=1 Tax=Porospora cf. gigantea B TaxID=2853592 RepID=UPI0035717C5D|nr:MAG: hypothetical protein KVP17_004832 [Porospora cf. gigantea B]
MVEQLAGKEGDPTFLPESKWLPEYGRHMIEATPGEPYDLTVAGSLVGVEESMRSRESVALGPRRPGEGIRHPPKQCCSFVPCILSAVWRAALG